MLELGNNQIKKVGQSLFKNGKNLDQLYLHSNILTADGIPSMRRLRKLLRLTLGDNQMTRIPRLPRSVERVNLRDNKFEGVLPRKSLSSLRHLQELILIRVQIANKWCFKLYRSHLEKELWFNIKPWGFKSSYLINPRTTRLLPFGKMTHKC